MLLFVVVVVVVVSLLYLLLLLSKGVIEKHKDGAMSQRCLECHLSLIMY